LAFTAATASSRVGNALNKIGGGSLRWRRNHSFQWQPPAVLAASTASKIAR
jgi:hypothetical protein